MKLKALVKATLKLKGKAKIKADASGAAVDDGVLKEQKEASSQSSRFLHTGKDTFGQGEKIPPSAKHDESEHNESGTASYASSLESKRSLTDEKIEELLCDIQDSETMKEAAEPMRELAELLAANQILERRKRTANRIVRLEGFSTLLIALELWHARSRIFSELVIRIFVTTTYLVHEAKPMLLHAGGLSIIINAAEKHADTLPVRSNAVALLGNLASMDDISDLHKVVHKKCVDIVLQSMKKWPADECIQKFGCIYIVNVVGIDDDCKSKLQLDERIDSILTKAINEFHTKSIEVHGLAKQAKESLL